MGMQTNNTPNMPVMVGVSVYKTKTMCVLLLGWLLLPRSSYLPLA